MRFFSRVMVLLMRVILWMGIRLEPACRHVHIIDLRFPFSFKTAPTPMHEKRRRIVLTPGARLHIKAAMTAVLQKLSCSPDYIRANHFPSLFFFSLSLSLADWLQAKQRHHSHHAPLEPMSQFQRTLKKRQQWDELTLSPCRFEPPRMQT